VTPRLQAVVQGSPSLIQRWTIRWKNGTFEEAVDTDLCERLRTVESEVGRDFVRDAISETDQLANLFHEVVVFRELGFLSCEGKIKRLARRGLHIGHLSALCRLEFSFEAIGVKMFRGWDVTEYALPGGHDREAVDKRDKTEVALEVI
jgi:hypothetical protein